MNVAVTQCVGVVLRAPSRVGSWLTPLLPNEPRILNPDTQAALTARYLLPVSPELEACLRAVRRQLDPELERQQPTKLGKPYPLGQCLEIAEAVQKRLRTVVKESLSPDAAAGLCALQAFQRAGGDFRQVWGDLRGQYFQNAFQVGTLYIDVANDTVTPTKPKVEILPFDEAQFIPICDFRHFRQIARRYWQDQIYPNHVLPELAPHCPLIHVSQSGRIKLHDATQYMLALTHAGAFRPSEAILREAPMPVALFEQIRSGLAEHGYRLPSDPEQGRRLALQRCRQFRAKRLHQQPGTVRQVIPTVQRLNRQLAQASLAQRQPERPMPTLKIDNLEYDLDSLSTQKDTHFVLLN